METTEILPFVFPRHRMFFEFNNKDYYLKPMIFNSEHELRFQGSYRFSEIKGFVT